LKQAITVSCGENGWDITIDMVKLRQIYSHAKASDIYLGDNTCTGSLIGDKLSFKHGLRECLTTEMVNLFRINQSTLVVYLLCYKKNFDKGNICKPYIF
jgi:hypothetical protein